MGQISSRMTTSRPFEGGGGDRPIAGRSAGSRSVELRDQVRWYEYGVSRGRGNPVIGTARGPASAAAVRCQALWVRWFAPGRSGPTAARTRGDSTRPPISASDGDPPPRRGRKVRRCSRKSLHLLNFRQLCGSFWCDLKMLRTDCLDVTVDFVGLSSFQDESPALLGETPPTRHREMAGRKNVRPEPGAERPWLARAAPPAGNGAPARVTGPARRPHRGGKTPREIADRARVAGSAAADRVPGQTAGERRPGDRRHRRGPAARVSGP